MPGTAGAQQALPGTSLVLEGVTVVDVERGKLLPSQRVVITGNRIRAMGNRNAVKTLPEARVVDARGKYLIPGLWDMHEHLTLHDRDARRLPLVYKLLLATGVTGIRNPGAQLSLDTLRQWRQAILAGTQVGPPRQLFSGQGIDGGPEASCMPPKPASPLAGEHLCVNKSTDMQRFVDSLKAAGVDMLKMYDLAPEMYFALAAAARRARLPFGGHAGSIHKKSDRLSAVAASDSGALIVDHNTWGLDTLCYYPKKGASVERCRLVADRFRRNGTWSIPHIFRDIPGMGVMKSGTGFWEGTAFDVDRLHQFARVVPHDGLSLGIAERAGLPILAGVDWGLASLNIDVPSGFCLHAYLTQAVAWGMTPLTALQSATLNPAKLLHATDSLGTVAPGKLADLVLLDANPLADIANTLTIRAVVANGRYFDRAALDALVSDVRAAVKAAVKPTP